MASPSMRAARYGPAATRMRARSRSARRPARSRRSSRPERPAATGSWLPGRPLALHLEQGDALAVCRRPGRAQGNRAASLLRTAARELGFNPDGTRLYVADHRDAQVLVVDTAADVLEQIIPLLGITMDREKASHHMRVRVSPDGRLLRVSYITTTASFSSIRPTRPGRSRSKPAGGRWRCLFHPEDPRMLYVSNHDEGTISIVDTRAGCVVSTFACGAGIESMELVPARD